MKQWGRVWILLLGVTFFGQPAHALSAAGVWIDTDIAAGIPFCDVDDGYAIVHALNNYGDRIVGMSISFGNTKRLHRQRGIVDKIFDLTGKSVNVVPGARSVGDYSSEGSRVLADYLKQVAKPIVFLALGRLTTLEGALRFYPAGVKKISEIIFVGGRRLDFDPLVGTHHIALTDSNFWGDEESFLLVLDRGARMTLIPSELAVQFEIKPDDLKRLKQSTEAASWLARKSWLWHQLWKFGLHENGFVPFDLLASSYFFNPERMHCEDSMGLAIMNLPDFSLGKDGHAYRNRPVVSNSDPHPKYRVKYCDSVGPDFHETLMRELMTP